MRIGGRGILLCTLLTTVPTGCILLYNGDGGSGGNGGSNASATGTGGAGAGGASSSAGSSGGNGGIGGNGDCTDGEAYCGPSSECDPSGEGFCTVVSVAASGTVGQVAVIDGSPGPKVVAYAPSVSSDHLAYWPLLFTQDEPASGTAQLSDPGIGIIAAGGPNHVYYFSQQENCDGKAGDDSCVSVCTTELGAIVCSQRLLTVGSHVNAAVMVRGNSVSEDNLYFAESNDLMSERLQRVARDCLESGAASCTAELATNYEALDDLDPKGMDRDPFDGSVWWNTWGGNGLTEACVYHYPAAGDLAQCVQTVPTIAHPDRLAVSANSVFVGTFSSAGAPGPIQRLGRCAVGAQHPVSELGELTWPADADGHFLYATSFASPNQLQVLNANTGALLTTLAADEALTSVDASNPEFLLFAAGDRIYRWRKPPSPCASVPGPGVCGDGCVDAKEDCDDGNESATDGCADCKCTLPL
jgi:hypothetical protein